jgi:hypothetical protein
MRIRLVLPRVSSSGRIALHKKVEIEPREGFQRRIPGSRPQVSLDLVAERLFVQSPASSSAHPRTYPTNRSEQKCSAQFSRGPAGVSYDGGEVLLNNNFQRPT